MGLLQPPVKAQPDRLRQKHPRQTMMSLQRTKQNTASLRAIFMLSLKILSRSNLKL